MCILKCAVDDHYCDLAFADQDHPSDRNTSVQIAKGPEANKHRSLGVLHATLTIVELYKRVTGYVSRDDRLFRDK